MKKVLLLLIFLSPSVLLAQKCLVSDHYTRLTGNQTQVINEPVSVCFSDHYFNFYTSQTGTISFEIDGPIEKTKSNGTEVETFMNAESASVPEDYYSVEIDNTNNIKTVVISCFATQTQGFDIMIESPSFVNNTDNSNVKPLKTIATNKSVYDSIQALNRINHVKDSMMNSKSYQMASYGGGRDSMYRFIGNRFKYNHDFKGYLTIAYTVDANGKATVNNINHNLNNNADDMPMDSVENDIKSIFAMMTRWRPGKKDGQTQSCDFVQTFSFPMPSIRYPYLDTKAYFPAEGGLLAFEEKVLTFPRGHGSSKGGTLYVQATINTDGNVVNPMVVKREGDVNSKDFDNEAYRIIRMMTAWVPAKLSNGNPVESTVEIPVFFKRTSSTVSLK